MSITNSSYHVNLFLIIRYPSRKEKGKLFLDRDGVLIEEKHFISNPKDVF